MKFAIFPVAEKTTDFESLLLVCQLTKYVVVSFAVELIRPRPEGILSSFVQCPES